MPPNILVIENDEMTTDVIVRILESKGYRTFFRTAPESIEEVAAVDPDLIILDDWVNGRSGQDFCTKLKSEEATKGIPVLLISTEEEIEQIAPLCHADSFLVMPFDIEALEAAVKKLL